MKILYYSTSYHAKHGGSIQSIEFYHNLKKNPEIRDFIFPNSGKDKILKSKRENSLKSILKQNPLFQFFSFLRNKIYLKKLMKRIEEIEPDVLVMQMDSNFLQIPKIKKLFPDVMVCTQINGSPFDEFYENIAFKSWLIRNQQECYGFADLNFFISEFSRSGIMQAALNPKRDKVIFNGTDISKFYPLDNKTELWQKLGYPTEKFIIGYIGTLDFHKKMLRLADAFKTVVKKFPQTELVIIGDGPAKEKLKAFIKQNGLQDAVQLKGWINHSSINEHLNCFDLAVHHYANKYMNPLKIFEYLAAGLPVIAPDIPNVRNMFTDGEDLLISSDNNSKLSAEIIRFIEDDSFRKKLSGNRGVIEKIAENYTWEAYTKNIISEIKSKLNQGF